MGGPFTCTDGTVFEKKSDWRKHEMLTQYTFGKMEDHEFEPKKPGDICGQAFDINDLVGCTAAVCDATDMVQIDNCTGGSHFFSASSSQMKRRPADARS